VKKIGCCFCGTPVIGKDLKKCVCAATRVQAQRSRAPGVRYCMQNSSLNEGIAFDLHKEKFVLGVELAAEH
jgi:hypothetical protein